MATLASHLDPTADPRALAEALSLARLSVAVARASGTREVATALLDEMALAVPDADTAVCLWDEPAGEFELVGVRMVAGRPVEVQEHWPFDLPTPARDVVLSKTPLSIDLATYRARYPDLSRLSDPEGMARYVALPIVAGTRAVGAVGLSWLVEPDLDDRAVAHLQRLVDTGGLALGRAGHEDDARRTRELLLAVVEQMPLAVLIVEPGAPGVVAGMKPEYTNAAFREMFGVRGEVLEPEERAVEVLRLDETPSPQRERPIVRAAIDGEVVRDELYLIQPRGLARQVVSVNAAPVRDAGGRVVAAVGVYVDVTRRHEAAAARDAFLGVLSHELRTPVTAIYGGAEILRRRLAGDPDAADLAFGLADEAARLHRLVEDLLVLSRVERGADLRRDDPVLVQHIVRRAVALEARRWPDVRFETDVPIDLPAIRGDEAYVEQIATNLLSNAGKYGGPRGAVVVSLRATDDEVVLSVRDHGPGFEPGAEARAFELFYRSKSAELAAPGAGIGLYAVKALAEAMGGRAAARNAPGGGAEVEVAFRVFEIESESAIPPAGVALRPPAAVPHRPASAPAPTTPTAPPAPTRSQQAAPEAEVAASVGHSATVILDRDGRYLDADEAALELLGVSSVEELRATPPETFAAIPPDPEEQEAWRRAYFESQAEGVLSEGAFRRLDGELVRVRTAILEEPDGRFRALFYATERPTTNLTTKLYRIADVLAEWRAAERRLVEVDPESADAQEIERQIEVFRDQYQRIARRRA